MRVPGADRAAPDPWRCCASRLDCGEHEMTGAVCQKREPSPHTPRTHGNQHIHFPCTGADLFLLKLSRKTSIPKLHFTNLAQNITAYARGASLAQGTFCLPDFQSSSKHNSLTTSKGRSHNWKSKVRGNLNIWTHNQLPWPYPAGKKMTTDGEMASLDLVISFSTPSSSSANYSHVM